MNKSKLGAHFVAILIGASSLAVAKGANVLQSAGPLAFAPGGVLIVSDPKAAALVSVKTGDAAAPANSEIRIGGINGKIAALLGTSPDAVRIIDLAVNPESHHAYLSVARGRGASASAVIVKASGDGDLSVVDLDAADVRSVTLPSAPADAETGEGRRRSNKRMESITDISVVDGNVIVAGLSNEEFASTLRSVPFPFKAAAKGASVEIYHGAHGRFETRSPIRTFVPYSIGGENHILAAYTCTPLVKVPVAQLKPGAHVKGTTIAELGNRNRPLDMLVYNKSGKDWFLMANSSRGVMKISTDDLAGAPSITSRVGGGGIQGQSFETIESLENVFQLAAYDSGHALLIQGGDNGALNLVSVAYP